MTSSVPFTHPPICARNPGRTSSPRFKQVSMLHETWPAFWREIAIVLWRHGYTAATVLYYRQILRAFSRHAAKPPRLITPDDVHAYMGTLPRDRYSWHWTAMNLSVLRTVFDKLGGLRALTNRRGPRRKRKIPEYLNRDEVTRLIEAATCLRDQLLVALIYGCGLKTGEVQRLVWKDIDVQAETLRVPSRWGHPDRHLPIPKLVKHLLLEGITRCPPEQPIFAESSGQKALCARRIQTIVSATAKRAGIEKIVLPVTLRHSYAVHFLQDGGTIRHLQENLDHRFLETTARYLDITDRPSLGITSQPSPITINSSFMREITDRFVRTIRGIRLYQNST